MEYFVLYYVHSVIVKPPSANQHPTTLKVYFFILWLYQNQLVLKSMFKDVEISIFTIEYLAEDYFRRNYIIQKYLSLPHFCYFGFLFPLLFLTAISIAFIDGNVYEYVKALSTCHEII